VECSGGGEECVFVEGRKSYVNRCSIWSIAVFCGLTQEADSGAFFI